MQPVLVDRGEFAAQAAIEIFDHPGIALHEVLLRLGGYRKLYDGNQAIRIFSRVRLRMLAFRTGRTPHAAIVEMGLAQQRAHGFETAAASRRTTETTIGRTDGSRRDAELERLEDLRLGQDVA